MSAVIKQVPNAETSLVVRMAQRFGVEPDKLLVTLKQTAFKGDVSTEQLMALLVVAEQYGLNPWTKELFAFPDKRAGIIPVVSVDGWSRILNSNPAFDGMEFIDGPIDEAKVPTWIECVIYRKDRTHAIKVKEYFSEVSRNMDGPWKTHPRRMLRHKAMIQCARLAFGFAGIFDQDEAERIIEATPADLGPRPDTSAQDPQEIDKWVGTITDVLNQDKEEVEIAAELRDINNDLSRFPEMFTAVFDALKARGVITKAKWKEYLTK
jgi:phage recombination protein Bet